MSEAQCLIFRFKIISETPLHCLFVPLKTRDWIGWPKQLRKAAKIWTCSSLCANSISSHPAKWVKDIFSLPAIKWIYFLVTSSTQLLKKEQNTRHPPKRVLSPTMLVAGCTFLVSCFNFFPALPLHPGHMARLPVFCGGGAQLASSCWFDEKLVLSSSSGRRKNYS